MEIKVRILDRDMFGRVLRTRFAPVKDDKATREFDALLAKIK